MFRPLIRSLKNVLNSIPNKRLSSSPKPQNQSRKTAKFVNKNKPNKKAKISIQKSRQQNQIKRISRFFVILFTTFVLMLQLSGLGLLFTLEPAYAATSLEIEPITWDFVGLDSNKPESQGPNTYVVGARVCNTGVEDARNVSVRFIKDGVDNGYAYIRLQSGDVYTFDRVKANVPANNQTIPDIYGRTKLTTGSIGSYIFDTPANGNLLKTKYTIKYTPTNCQDFYYNFEVTRTDAAWNTYQKYYLEATANNAFSVRTARPRQNYIEKLISQARNEVYFFGCDALGGQAYIGPTVTVGVGDTFTCQARAHTATAYPQMSFTSDIPNVIFQVLDVQSSYSDPVGGINSTVYADGCGWVQDPSDPRYHLSPGSCSSETGFANTYSDQYPYTSPPTEGKGAVGNDITTIYKIKVIAFPNGIPNPIKVSNVILDYSGSSYHYNADYGITPNVVNITVVNPSPTDLSVVKTHAGNFSFGDNTYSLTVSDNANSANAKAPVILTDTLPAGYTFKDMNLTLSGTQPLSGGDFQNWNCDTSGQLLTCLYDTDRDGVGDNFPDGGTSALTLNVNIVNGALPSGTTSTNFVRVALNTAQTDSVPANNTSSDPTTIFAGTNLLLQKDDSAGDFSVVGPIGDASDPENTFIAGGTATYRLKVTNTSTVDAAGPITIIDTLPTGVFYSSASGTNWTCSATGQTVVCTNPNNLTASSVTNLTLTVNVLANAPTSVTNTAIVSSPNLEPNTTNNTATQINNVTIPTPDLKVTKTDNGLDFVFDQNLANTPISNYIITVKNLATVNDIALGSGGVATIVTTDPIYITDTLPTQLTYIGVDSLLTTTGWTCNVTTDALPDNGDGIFIDADDGNGIAEAFQTVYCSTTNSLAPGDSNQIAIQVKPNIDPATPTTITNTVKTLTGGETYLVNNTATDTSTIIDPPQNTNDVRIAKLSNTPSGPGQGITYTMNIFNDGSGSNDVTGTGTFVDVIPPEVTITGASCTETGGTGNPANTASKCCGNVTAGAPTISGQTVTCNTYSLRKSSGSIQIIVGGTVNAATYGNIVNTALVTPGPGLTDKVPSNNVSTVTTTVPGPDLGIAKIESPSTPEPWTRGVNATYRLTVTNTSATLTASELITVTDPLPSQLTFFSAVPAPGSSAWDCSASGNNVVCITDQNLAPGATTSIDITVTPNTAVASPGVSNTATVSSSGDTNAANNTSTQQTVINAPQVDLRLLKVGDSAPFDVGKEETYTLTVTNDGTAGATTALSPITLVDQLPAGLTYLYSNTPSGTNWICSESSQIVTCTLYADLAPNASSSVVIHAQVSPSAVSPVVNQARVSSSGDPCSSFTCNDADDVGGTPDRNGQPTDNRTSISTTVNPTADLAIVKTAVDQNTGTAGNQFYQDGPAVYNITVTNNGPSTYTGSVIVNEDLSAITPSDPNFTYVSHSDNTIWTCTSGVGSCVGNKNLVFTKTGGLLAGESSTIALTINVPDVAVTGSRTNVATIDAATIAAANDTVAGNNTDNEVVEVLDNQTTLTLVKDDNDGTGEPTNADLQTKFFRGGIGKYTIVATNTGGSAAKAPVTISDPLPTGLTYAGTSRTSNWDCSLSTSSNVSCIYGNWNPTFTTFTQANMPVGTISGVEISVNVSSTATLSTLNTALNPDVYDANLTTNPASISGSNFTTVNASENTVIIEPADLAVTKSITPDTPPDINAGEAATYTITVTNVSLANNPASTGVSYPQIYLQDYLPTGLTYKLPLPATGANVGDGWEFIGYNSGSNEVTYKRTTALANGASTNITLPVSVSATPPASVTNFVRVGGFTPEPDYDLVTSGYQDPRLASCDASLGANQPVNNCFALTTPILGGVATDLKVAKIEGTDNDNLPNPAVGFNTNFNYTIRVANISSNNAETVTLNDILPPSLEYVSHSIDAGDATITNPYGSIPTNLTRTCSYDNGTRTFRCNLIRVSTAENDGDPVDITLTVKSLVSGIVDNTATVTSVTADSNTTNNTESEKVLVNTGGANTISGKVFNDVNDSGPSTPDSGENGTQNVTVRLYQDNGTTNSAFDAGDTLIASAITNATGDYSFGTSLTGNFVLNVDTSTLPSGHVLTQTSSPTTFQTAGLVGTPSSDPNNNFGHKGSVVAIPSLNLVKRITAINNNSITGFVNDPGSTNDDDGKWSTDKATYLRGAIACTSGSACNSVEGVKSGDLVEYTVYFLSNGTENLKNAQICDAIPINTTFEFDTYGTGNGILLGWDSAGGVLPDPANSTLVSNVKVALTNVADSDTGKFLAINTAESGAPSPCSLATNSRGAVLVKFGLTPIIPPATSAGTPTSSYGFVRFKVKIN